MACSRLLCLIQMCLYYKILFKQMQVQKYRLSAPQNIVIHISSHIHSNRCSKIFVFESMFAFYIIYLSASEMNQCNG